MNTAESPPPKRTKLDPSPSPNDKDAEEAAPNDNADSLEQEHCAICLQPFLDRAIIPVCAHEFCFECILLWSEQSRKCPLCSRSFDDSYLIHHVRSQYDYQKHYLLPLRSSPPSLTGESHANALRNTRRERQWGRRQRRQREEADQLERAIARRRWIYQHHLYAKHVASNPYTRYRPFPTPAQFAVSPDLVRRMMTFLRRELRVWPNLDVEFLTTYIVSLMKSIDIRSEPAIKLLSEFLDLDKAYTPGERRINAEHFAHEIYSYLRSPYRDLNVYDQTAQYDTPPGLSPPRETERSSRWSTEPSPSRRSRSRANRLRTHRENNATPALYGRESSAEARRETKPSRRHSFDHSPRDVIPDSKDHDYTLRNDSTGGMLHPETSTSTALAGDQNSYSLTHPHSRSNEKGKSKARENMRDFVPLTGAPKLSEHGGDDSATVPTVGDPGSPLLVDGSLQEGGSSANPHSSRKRPTGRVRPGNRTLSESVQAYLSKPATPRHPTQTSFGSADQQVPRASETDSTGRSATEARPRLLFRLSDGPTPPNSGDSIIPQETIANGDLSMRDDGASEQQHHGYRLQSHPFPAATHAHAVIQQGDQDGSTRSH